MIDYFGLSTQETIDNVVSSLTEIVTMLTTNYYENSTHGDTVEFLLYHLNKNRDLIHSLLIGSDVFTSNGDKLHANLDCCNCTLEKNLIVLSKKDFLKLSDAIDNIDKKIISNKK